MKRKVDQEVTRSI